MTEALGNDETEDLSVITTGRLLPSDEHDSAKASLHLPSAGDVDQLAIANGLLFFVTNRRGEVSPPGARELGFFHDDTRYLSQYELRIPGAQIVWLSSSSTAADRFSQVDLMLSDLKEDPEHEHHIDDPKNFLHIRRRQIVDGALFEQIRFTNFLRCDIKLEVSILFGADFADIFEVRGAHRARRGQILPPRVNDSSVVLGYDGLSGHRFESVIRFATPPLHLSASCATFELHMPPRHVEHIDLSVHPRRSEQNTPPSARPAQQRSKPDEPLDDRVSRLRHDYSEFHEHATRWRASDARITRVLGQSISDLYSLRLRFVAEGTHTILGAGIPWFCAPFGRDSLIAAYECLTLEPDLARDTLRTLAACQGKTFVDETEEEPGKIFHEMRFGEMALTHEIPHRPYYGSIDATLLFIILVDAHFRVSADRAFLKEMEPALRAALAWADARSGEGCRLITYERKTSHGLENQGWKDSRTGVCFPDGRPAEPPIALVEVQGYCVDAYVRGSRTLAALGDPAGSAVYAERAAQMREVVNREMWLDTERRYAFAVDGEGRRLSTVVSNIGHLLWSRVPPPDRAKSVAELLTSPASFSGFGVRTLATGQPIYNPLSYHNGTVWPHDNAIIARGFANYGFSAQVLKIFDGLYVAMDHFIDHRLPELFCGIEREAGALVRYPVACRPQAWAAAAPFLLFQSMLGIHIDAPGRRLSIRAPRLPRHVRTFAVEGMRVGDARATIRFFNEEGRCRVDDVRVEGGALKAEVEMT